MFKNAEITVERNLEIGHLIFERSIVLNMQGKNDKRKTEFKVFKLGNGKYCLRNNLKFLKMFNEQFQKV